MKCDCCMRKKGWFEVFEPILYENQRINLCVDCSKRIYKIRDDQKYGKTNEANQLIKFVLTQKSSAAFRDWFLKSYMYIEETDSHDVNSHRET